MELFAIDRHYPVIEFDPSQCFNTNQLADDDATANSTTEAPLTTFLLRLYTVARFWAELTQRFYVCEVDWGAIDVAALGITRRERRAFGQTIEAVVEQHFPTIFPPVAAARRVGSMLSRADPYLRLMQINQIMMAIDALMQEDLLASLARFTFDREKEEERIRDSIMVLYEEIMPRALAGLWLWKTHERFKSDTLRVDTHVQMLWIAMLKLRALTEFSHTSDQYAASDLQLIDTISYDNLSGLFSVNECPVNNTAQPIMQYSLRDLWSLLLLLNWTWPHLCPGRTIALLLDALWKRAALFVSVASKDGRAFNFIALIQRVSLNDTDDANGGGDGEKAWRVNAHFVTETERIFYYLCDSMWTFQWFLRHRAPATNGIDQLLRGPMPEWQAFVKDATRGTASQFIKLQYGKSIWEMNARRDEIERYNNDTKTRLGNPNSSVRQYHRPEYDILVTLANASPSGILPTAIDTMSDDWNAAVERRKRLAGHEFYRNHTDSPVECRWRSILDLQNELSATHVSSGKTNNSSSTDNKAKTHMQKMMDDLTFTVATAPSGELQYFDKATKRRLRGQVAVDAAVLYTERKALTGRCEYDAISEEVLRLQMEFNINPLSPRLRVVREVANLVRLDTITARVDTLKDASNLCPTIVRVANQYVLFDGHQTIATNAFLCQILNAWCASVDNGIDQMLRIIGRSAEIICEDYITGNGDARQQRENVNRIRKRAADVVARVPDNLRKIMKFERHEKLMIRPHHSVADVWFGQNFQKLMIHEKFWSADMVRGISTVAQQRQRQQMNNNIKKSKINW